MSVPVKGAMYHMTAELILMLDGFLRTLTAASSFDNLG